MAKLARRTERERKQKEKRELEELVRLAKDILVEDHKKQTEQAKLAKLAEKELKMVSFPDFQPVRASLTRLETSLNPNLTRSKVTLITGKWFDLGSDTVYYIISNKKMSH